jgi:hypothetical protein
MAKRWYIAPVIGTGAEEDAYRPKVPEGINWVAVIPSNPDGTPRFNWCLVKVAATDHSALLNDAEIDAMPNIALDDPISTLSAAMRNAIQNRLEARGIDTSGITLQTTFRQIVRRIGRHLDTDFGENALDIADS